ncbi:uncharacterized protein B0H64DRAFT_431288 [Chaetomium fimeti]|uniref:Xylanolytic transcriptional activator regulatory domain-containing protein n=1 Tax=Chaetomium fimeti TaxID=1854472 RepID=A0AAE0HIR8_9PEZI|nr:hypothetical protein B0H64DRAFT_431288 [Chaetomium fimeti]
MTDTTPPMHEFPDSDSLLAEHEAQRPRKKVRKGTRSCWEFASVVNSNQVDVHDRLGRMERLVKKLVEQMTRDSNAFSGIFLGDGLFRSTPDANIFGRNILAGSMPLPRLLTPDTSITWACDKPVAASSKLGKLSQRLAEAWPSQHELDRLLSGQVESSESLVLKASGMPYSGSASVQDILQMPPPGSHPVFVARKLLLLGIFLQGPVAGPLSEDAATDTSPSCYNIASGVVEAASLVTGNDELANSIEGIECIMMESLYHDLAGNLRRAWVAIRRAITMAQMMGLHRGADVDTPSLEVFDTGPRVFIDPQNLWLRLLQADRYTSLMLDLPQSSLDDVFASPRALERCTSQEKMRRLDCLAAGRILQRTTADMNDYTTTREIDTLLQTASASMPAQWWLTPDLSATSLTNPTTALTNGTTLMDQFVHFHLVGRLHLPYLLHPPSSTDHTSRHDHTYSQLTAMTATREMLARFLAFRALSPTAPYCRGMDFFAFIAAATLCVAHIQGWGWRRRQHNNYNNHHQNHNHNTNPEKDSIDSSGNGGMMINHLSLLAHQRPSDRGLAERTLVCIEQLAGVHVDDVATGEMADVLGRLLGMEEDAARGDGEEWALDGVDMGFEDILDGLGRGSGVSGEEQGRRIMLYI